MIYIIRGRKVLMDSDLSALGRFPDDFMFQLTEEEFNSLRYQIGTLDKGRGKYRKYLPLVLIER